MIIIIVPIYLKLCHKPHSFPTTLEGARVSLAIAFGIDCLPFLGAEIEQGNHGSQLVLRMEVSQEVVHSLLQEVELYGVDGLRAWVAVRSCGGGGGRLAS